MSDVFGELIRLATEHRRENHELVVMEQPIPVVQDPEDVDRLLRDKSGDTHKHLDWLRQVIGPSRISENGEAWRLRWQVSQAHFQGFDADKLGRDAVAVIEENLGLLERASDTPPLPNALFYRIVLDVFLRSFLGTALEASGLDERLMHRMVMHAARNSYISYQSRHLIGDEERRDNLKALLEDRASVLKSFARFRQRSEFSSPLLDDLLAAEKRGQGFNFEQELLTIVAAGTESTAATFGWSLHLVAGDQLFQKRLFDEVSACNSLPGDLCLLSDGAVTFLVNEALRRFPAFPILSRIATADIWLKRTSISSGQAFIISLLGAHYDGFLEEHSPLEACFRSPASRQPSHFTFGAGRRVCGGRAFAMLELKALVAATSLHFRIRPAGRTSEPPVWCLALVPPVGQNVKLTRRKAGSDHAPSVNLCSA